MKFHLIQINSMLTATINQWQLDDLRDYIDVLEKAPDKDKYICPLCNGNDLSIGKNGFTCYSGNCNPQEIYKSVKQLAGKWVEHSNSSNSYKLPIKPQINQAQTSKPKLKLKSVSFQPDNLTLAQFPSLPTDIPQPFKPNWIPKQLKEELTKLGTLDTLKMITYPYSKSTWLDRYQWVDKSKAKGRSKRFLWGSKNPETGEIKRKKLEEVNPYRFDEVLDYASGKCFLAVEGEKSIEACRSIGLIASDISALQKSSQCLISVKEKDITVLILPDKDRAGIDKADALEKACLEHQIKYHRLDVYRLWADKPDWYDIAEAISEPNMNAEQILKVLSHQIKEAIETKVVEQPLETAFSQNINQDTHLETELP